MPGIILFIIIVVIIALCGDCLKTPEEKEREREEKRKRKREAEYLHYAAQRAKEEAFKQRYEEENNKEKE